MKSAAEFKVVGKSGQISLGKSYAGKTLRVDRKPDGRIVLTAVAMVPEHLLWTTQEPHRGRIRDGLEWARHTPARETNLDEIEHRALKRRTRGR